MCLATFLTVKVLYFVYFGASSCLLPYLSLHMKTLGIPVWETAIINGVVPLFQILSCLLVATFAQNATSYKKSTMWCLLFATLSSALLLMSPEIPSPARTNITMHFQCGPDISPGVIIDRCEQFCENEGVKFVGNNVNTYFTECHVDCPNKKGIFKNTADLCFADHLHNRVCHVVEVNNTSSENFTFGISLGNVKSHIEDKCLYAMNGVTWHQAFFQRITCPIILTDETVKCILTCNLQEVIDGDKPQIIMGSKYCLREGTKAITYAIWMYSGLRALFQFAYGTSSTMVDNGLINFFKTQRRNHQKYVIWSHVASAVLTPLAGLTIDYRKNAGFGSSSYNWIFFAFAALTVLSIASLGPIEFENVSRPSMRNTVINILKLFTKLNICLFLFWLLLLSIVSGFFDVFLFWYLEDLSTPYWVMGLTVSTGFFIGSPMLTTKFPHLIKRIGKHNLLITCLTCQTMRCLGYYFIKKFWWSLLLEFFGSLSFHILWKTVSISSKNLLPSEKAISLHACANIIYFGIGKSCGSFAGGLLMVTYGFEKVFLFFAIICGVSAISYFILYHSVFQRLSKRLAEREKRKAGIVAGLDDPNSAFLLKQPSISTIKNMNRKADFQEDHPTELVKLNVHVVEQ